MYIYIHIYIITKAKLNFIYVSYDNYKSTINTNIYK